MPANVVNYQKNQTSPPSRNLKIQSPSQNRFSPGTLKSDSPPPERTLWKILISPQNFGEKWHYVTLLFEIGSCSCLSFYWPEKVVNAIFSVPLEFLESAKYGISISKTLWNIPRWRVTCICPFSLYFYVQNVSVYVTHLEKRSQKSWDFIGLYTPSLTFSY